MLTKPLKTFSSKSGYTLQNQWNAVYEFFGEDPLTLWVWGTFLLSTALYWSVGMCYTVMDLTGKPEFIRKYKIQEVSTNPVSLRDVLKVIKQVVFNQVITFPFFFLAYYMMVLRGYDSRKSLPSLQRILCELVICVLTNEVWFYYTHKLMHQPTFYKHIHKIHHQWTSPIAISALYCHPLEYFFSDMISGFVGPFLLGSHTVTMWLWFSFVLVSTLTAHSGYGFPFPASPIDHDAHHLKFNSNYGFWGILDPLLGTDYKSSCKKSD